MTALGHVYIAASDQQAVAEAVSRALAAGGRRSAITQAENSIQVHAKHNDPARPEWSATIAPGAKGWTRIATQPGELFAEPIGSEKPLLADICHRVRARGFLFSVRGPVDAVLIEADSRGEYLLSGCLFDDCSGNVPTFHGHALPADRVAVSFDIVPIYFDILDLDNYQQLAEYLEQELGAGKP